MGTIVGVEVDRGCGSAAWDGVGCGEVDVTTKLEVAKTGGGKKSASDGGVLKRVPLMIGMLEALMTTEDNKGLT